MAIVRELTTLIDFKVDSAGLSQAESAVNTLKSSLFALGKLFGFVFAAEKIYEWVDELFNVGKEINKLTYQLNRMAREGDNIPVAMESLFTLAQKTGIEYTEVLDSFREMLNESKELNVSQDQLLMTTENIYTALRLSAASGDEIKQVFSTLNRAFRMGRIGRRQLGLLGDLSPDLIDALASSLGKTREQLEEMAKDSKLTAKELINGLGKVIPKLGDDFAARPRKLGEAFTYAWNAAGRLSARIWKVVNVTGVVANAFVRFVDFTANGLESLSKHLGGLKKTLELLAITVAVVAGPAFVRALALAVGWTTRLILRNLVLIATYAAWAAAIAAVVLGIQDIMVWMQGGDSVIGDWVGPFSEFVKEFQRLFDTGNFFAPFKAIQELFSGDFSAAWEKFKQSIRDVDGLLGLLALSILAVTVGFKAWTAIRFVPLIAAITGVAAAVKTVSVASALALTDMMKIAKARILLAGGVVGAAILLGLYGKEMLESGMDAILGRDPEKAQAERSAAQNAGSSQFWSMINPRNWFPSITPGQVIPGATGGPGGTVGSNNTVNQTNNVTIQVDPNSTSIAGEIKDKLTSLFDSWGRQARNAVPVTEAPKQ